jgi:hypothetical protein
MSQERLNDELAAIEAALCSLTPAASGIQRDRLMFLAGKAAGNRSSSRRRLVAALWPLATAASLLAATAFGILWAAGNGSQAGQQLANPLFAAAPSALDACGEASPPSPWANRHLCRLVLEKGVDALPESSVHRISGMSPTSPEDSYRSLLKRLLDNPTG